MADNNPQLQSVIRFQEAYMEQEKFHKRKVRTIRSMLLVLFLALRELCTRLDMIDDFIFSSPSRVLFCFWKMVRDGSIFAHIGITLFETVVSFLIVTVAGIFVAVLLWTSRSASEVLEPYLVMLNSLPKSALAPMLIVWMGSHVHTIIAAAVSVAVFGSILTLHTGFFFHGSRQNPPDLCVGRQQKGCAHEGASSRFRSADFKQHEGECGAVPGGRDHWGISGGETGTWVSHYLWESGFSAGLCHALHRSFMPVLLPPLQAHCPRRNHGKVKKQKSPAAIRFRNAAEPTLFL